MRATKRRAITLLEVLISMFILLIGLMGVAAMIPAGKFEIQQGSQVDHASMVGRAAFRDLKIRGYLNPNNWTDSGGAAIYQPANYLQPFNLPTGATIAPAVAIDPLGLFAFGAPFPAGAGTPQLTRIVPHRQVSSASLADAVFRSTDDNIFTPNTNKDYAPTQQVVPFGAGGTAIVKRDSVGSYTWLATVVADPSVQGTALSSTSPIDPNPAANPLNYRTTVYTVSVAVFFKRDLSTANSVEGTTAIEFVGLPGTEIALIQPIKEMRVGTWMMLAGTTTGPNGNPPPAQVPYNYFRWYQVVAADKMAIDQNDTAMPKRIKQFLTLKGPDWSCTAANTTAFLFDNIIAVYEKQMRLEIPAF